MIKNMLTALCAAAALCASCDDGRIYEKEIVIPQEGLTLKMTGSFTGMDTWPSNYSLVLASFKDDSESAQTSTSVPLSANNSGEVTVKLSGLKGEVSDLELCVIDRLRDRVVTFCSITRDDIVAVNDTVYMNVGQVDVSMYKAIQTSVFDAKCISCHGANGGAPRSLYLTEGKSHDALVGKDSQAAPGYKLVEAGNAAASLLPIVLSEDGLLHHNHSDILEARKKSNQIALIRSWINNGARE